MTEKQLTNTPNQGKTYLITGATGGIGAEIIKKLSADNNQLIIVSRNEQKLSMMIENHQSDTATFHPIAADLNTAAGIKQLIDSLNMLLENQQLSLDVIIQAAGTQTFAPFEQLDDVAIGEQIQVNLLTPMLLTRKLLPIIKRQSNSQLAYIGSTFGNIGFSNFASYCASKFGLRGFCEALRRELTETTVNVNYIAPRAVDTKMNAATMRAFAKATKMPMDQPAFVASEILKAIHANKPEHFIGRKELFFAKLNGLFPSLVGKEIIKQNKIAREIFSHENTPR